MFAATQQQQQQQEPQQKQAAAATTTAEEEALKRNTDCVYFLASPLTCKKGSECEYRHSEYARVNPRDCYYWLNGNCLNPKCGFRHPPLDGLLGNQGGGAAAASSHASHHAAAASASAPQAPYNVGKPGVPCVFFQKGTCLKGDRCAFLHMPNSIANKNQQPAEAMPVTEHQSLKKPFRGFEKCTQEKNFPSVNVSKAVGIPVEVRAATKAPSSAPGHSRSIEKNLSLVGFEKKTTNVPSVAEGAGRSNHFLQVHGLDDTNTFQNGKDADDFLRESSPGFDVLVDNELRDSDYYPGEDQYGRRGQDGKNSVNEYDPDFDAIADADREVFRDPHGYDSYEHMEERQYAWGQRRASSEIEFERRGYSKDESPDNIHEPDLRYRLSKQRRFNGLRSVVSRDHTSNYSEEQGLHGSRRDTPPDSSLSSRLQGRIKLPGRVSGSDSQLERGMERGRNRSRLSPGRQQMPYQGRLRDRINGRVEENYGGEDGNFRATRTRREMGDERSTEFPAPKRLAELKGGKDESKGQEPYLRKRKSLEDHRQQSEDDLSFDGPLPLSEILKRKRAAAAYGSGISSSVSKEDTPEEIKESAVLTIPKEETNKEDSKSATEEKTEAGNAQSTEPPTMGDELGNVEGIMVDEGMEDQELEGEDPNREYDYEQGYDEGEYYEEGENAEGEEEYVEEEEEEEGEEGNDFAKKIDVMFS